MSADVTFVLGALTTATACELAEVSTSITAMWADDGDAASGVREPRRPVRPSRDGAVALELPDDMDVAA